ncbi:MAG: NAD-dependent epimerase/dehydratase family protein [Deltaproteobacteria bacterium]|nr:NAD-dependent epimerase/dehydratase family protein [Deltaproteobacteria bacterium]
MDKSALITGGCGFIGSSLAVALARAGWQVTCLDNLSRRGSELILERLREHGCGFVHADIRCPEDLAKVAQRGGVLIECSAEPSVLAGSRGELARGMLANNLVGALNCFELARERGMAVVFFSSSRVYPYDRINALRFEEVATRFELAEASAGVSRQGIDTGFSLEGRRSLYGATKLAGELVLQEYSAQFEVPAVINRCGVVAGPWQLGKVDQGVFTFWLAAHHFQRPLRYLGFGGTGKQVRDLLHVGDLAELVLRQLEHLGELRGEVFNAGGSTVANLSLQETTALCREITGSKVLVEPCLESRPADVVWYLTDNRKAQERFGWTPRRDARAILADTYAWLREHERELARVLGFDS